MKEFIKKEFRYILRDRWTTLIILVLPMLMIILFGYGITTEIKNSRFNVVDLARSNSSLQLVERLQQSEYFTLNRYMGIDEDFDAALGKNNVGFVLVIPSTLDRDLAQGDATLQIVADGSDPNTASTLVNYATTIVAGAATSAAAGRQPVIQCNVKMLYNPTMKGAYNTVPGVMGMIIMLVCTMMTSIAVAKEKETGSMEVLLVSPIRPHQIVLAKMTPYFVVTLIDYCIMLLLAVFVMGVPINGSLLTLTLATMVFVLLSLALGVLISIVASSQIAAMLVSAVVMLIPTILLSGIMFPVETMPLFFRLFSRVIPATWYIDICRRIMIQGVGLGGVALPLGVLAAFAVALFALCIKKFNRRLE